MPRAEGAGKTEGDFFGRWGVGFGMNFIVGAIAQVLLTGPLRMRSATEAPHHVYMPNLEGLPR